MTTRPTLDSTPEDASLAKWTRDVEGFVEDLIGSPDLPSAPAEVKVVSQTNSVKVTFRAVNEVGVSEYKIYRSTEKNFTGGTSELIATVVQAIDPSATDIVYIDSEATEKSYYFVSAVKGLRRPRLEGLVAGFGSATTGHAIGEDVNGGTISGFSGISGSILFANDSGLIDQDNDNLFYSQPFKVPVAGPAGISWGPHNLPDVFLVRDAADTLALRRGSNPQFFRIYETTPATSAPAITQTLLLNEIDAVSRTVYVTGSVNPAANKLILCCVSASDQGFAGPITTTSVTGAGLTWVKVAEVQFDTDVGPRRVNTIFRALGPAPSAGALTITMDGAANVGQWIIVELDNIDIGGANGADAIVQAVTNSNDASASLIATLAAFGSVNNATFGAFTNGASNGSWTPGAGFTEIADHSNVAQGQCAIFKSGNDITVDSTYTLSGGIAGIALEIKSVGVGDARYLELNGLGASGAAEVMAVTGSGATDRALVVGTRGNESIDFYVNNAEAVRIESTGELLIQDGTSLLPGMAFISDPDSGVFTIPSNRIGIAGGGIELMRLQNTQVTIQGTSSLVWATGTIGGPDDVRLRRTAPYTLKLELLTNPGTFEIYNTFTDATTNELAELGFIPVANTFVIGTKKGSVGGVARPMVFRTDETEILRLGVSGVDVSSMLHSQAFTSGGTGTAADLHRLSGTLTGASGDTTSLFGHNIDPTIATQTAVESIANIASLNIEEPKITDTLTGDITVASTVRIGGAPTEGVRNYAFRIEAGAMRVGTSNDALVPDLEFDQDGFGFVRSGSSRLALTLIGTATEVAWAINSGQFMRDSAFLGWSDNANPLGAAHRTEIRRQADGVLELRNVPLTTPTGFELFKTWVSATNNEVGQITWLPVADVFVIGTKKGSAGGTARPMTFRTDEIAAMTISITQNSTFFGNVNLEAAALGNDIAGRCAAIERNTNGGAEGPAPGSLDLEAADGASLILFSDDDGDLRVHTAKPTGSTGTPTVDANTAGFKLSPLERDHFHFASRIGSFGVEFSAGGYTFSAADANLTQASTTVTIGTANHPYYAHAFLVAAAAGAASGGAGLVEIEVSGTSIDDNGVRTAADTEVIVADITAMATDQYFETTKKWIGTVTWTLQVAGGGTHTTFNADFNYGLAKYEDFGNMDFELTGFELTGRAGAADTGFNVELCEHKATGWTYSAAAFVAGLGTALVDVAALWSTESDLASGELFAFKKLDISSQIAGSGAEGYIIRVTTGANAAVETMNMTVTARLN